MQWLLQLSLARPDALQTGLTDSESQLVGQHFAYWQDLTERGIAFVVGRTQDEVDPLGLAIFSADDEATADKIVQADPGVSGGVFLAKVRPYQIALKASSEHVTSLWN